MQQCEYCSSFIKQAGCNDLACFKYPNCAKPYILYQIHLSKCSQLIIVANGDGWYVG